MANGYKCEKCGYPEAEHENVAKKREEIKKLQGKEKKEVTNEIKLEFPGICKKYKNSNPKSRLEDEKDFQEEGD